MEVTNVSLANVAVAESQFPTLNLPEIAFVGKSNVGKSSLINCLINRKGLARTSQNPGKTRTINFYNVEEQLFFVDLPGYGYAKLSRSQSEKWGEMIENYLLKRPQLKLIVLLIDMRHEPNANDIQMYEWLKHYDYEMLIVATKKDKLKRSQWQKHTSIIRKGLNANLNHLVVPFSAETKEGKDEIWKHIEQHIEQHIDHTVES